MAIWRPKTHDYIGIQGCRFWFWDQFWPQWPWNWQFEASCSISGVKPIASLGTWPPTFRKFPDVLKNGRDVIVTVIPIELVCKTDGVHRLVHEASKEVIVRSCLGEKKVMCLTKCHRWWLAQNRLLCLGERSTRSLFGCELTNHKESLIACLS